MKLETLKKRIKALKLVIDGALPASYLIGFLSFTLNPVAMAMAITTSYLGIYYARKYAKLNKLKMENELKKYKSNFTLNQVEYDELIAILNKITTEK